MMTGTAATLPMRRAISEKTIKPYFSMLPRSAMPQCLNFRANIGISETRSHEQSSMSSTTDKAPHEPSKSEGMLTSSEAQKSALAGVGMPMKPNACLSSRLNLARRKAENAAMT